VSAILATHLPSELALAPSLWFVAYVAATWFPVVDYIWTINRPFYTMMAAVLAYSVLGLGSIWTVAFPFVPFGGSIARENTPLVRSYVC
jgi:hypothetical protein